MPPNFVLESTYILWSTPFSSSSYSIGIRSSVGDVQAPTPSSNYDFCRRAEADCVDKITPLMLACLQVPRTLDISRPVRFSTLQHSTIPSWTPYLPFPRVPRDRRCISDLVSVIPPPENSMNVTALFCFLVTAPRCRFALLSRSLPFEAQPRTAFNHLPFLSQTVIRFSLLLYARKF